MQGYQELAAGYRARTVQDGVYRGVVMKPIEAHLHLDGLVNKHLCSHEYHEHTNSA